MVPKEAKRPQMTSTELKRPSPQPLTLRDKLASQTNLKLLNILEIGSNWEKKGNL